MASDRPEPAPDPADGGDATWSWRVDSDRVAYSAGWHAILGEPKVSTVESLHAWLGRVHPDDVATLTAALDRHLSGEAPEFRCEHRIRTRQGAFRWTVAQAVAERDGQGRATQLVGSLADVSERNQQDPLARLPGLGSLRAHVARLVEGARVNPAARFALLLVDLDHFGHLNATLGHENGDALLREALLRISRCLREGDLVARIGATTNGEATANAGLPPLGGDECAVVLSHLMEPRDALRVTARIHDALAAPFPVVGHRLFTSACIGVSVNSPAHDMAEDLLRDAHSALVRARAKGQGETQLFDDSARAGAEEFMELASDVGAAIEGGQFEVFYQPTVELHDGSIVRVEALLRWRHPSRGLLRPNVFVPLLQDTGAIVPVGWTAVADACAALAGWRAVHPPAHGVRVSVNLLSRQFLQPDLIERLHAIVGAAGLDPGDVELELSEIDVMTHYEQAVEVARALRAAEFKVALDDFGSGLASTEHIRALGVHTIKIDRAYIAGNANQTGSTAIVQYAVELSAILGIDVVAEGVETPTELDTLRHLGCPMVQGFLFSRAIPAPDLLALLQRSDASPAGTAWWTPAEPAVQRRRPWTATREAGAS